MTIENHMATLLQALEGISQVRVRLDRTLLKNQKHEHQPKITQLFSVQISRTAEDSEPELNSDQFEDYRGESD